MTKLNKKLIWAVLLGMATLLVVGAASDYQDALRALEKFQLRFLPIVLGLTFINYLLRFVKWHYFLGIIDAKLPLKRSFAVFLSGLAMSVTPGKVGELLKSYLLKQLKGVPLSKSAPIIFAERLSDGFGLAILSMTGIWYVRYGKQILGLVGIMLIGVVVLVQFPAFLRKAINLITKIPFLKKHEQTFHNLLDSANVLLKPAPLLFTIVISVVSWSFECIAFYYVFVGLGYKVPLLVSTFTLSFSGIVGAVSMLPGGLGAAEASLLGLLLMTGVPKSYAGVGTVLIRFCTLWFGVTVGTIALLSNKRILGFAKDFDTAVMENESGI